MVSLLRPLIKKGVPRSARLALANIARRCGQPLMSLHLLRPIVRAERKLSEPASPAERASFGAGLISIGAIDEGFEIFKAIDAEAFPEILLHTSLAHISRWDYQKAIAPLQRYIANPRISAYQRLIGKLNLADALNFVSEYAEAQRILLECVHELEADKNSNRFAKQVAHEYLAQSYLHYGGKAKARASLRAAKKAASGSVPNTIFVAKWEQVIRLQSKTKRLPQDANEFYRIREKAVHAKLWEGVRDVDYQLARFGFRPDLVAKLRLGTPLGSYQQKLQTQFGEPPPHESVIWHPGLVEKSPDTQDDFSKILSEDVSKKLSEKSQKNVSKNGSGEHQILFNLQTGEIKMIAAVTSPSLTPRAASIAQPVVSESLIKQKMFSQGGLPLRLMQVLSEDFYVPARLGRVFRTLYPNENFNPITSPKRVAQLAFRVNSFFNRHGIDLKIVSANYSLSFVAGPNVQILKVRTNEFLDRQTAGKTAVKVADALGSAHRYRVWLEQGHRIFGQDSFTNSEFSESLKLPPRSTHRILSWGVTQGLLQVSGHKKSSRYRF